MKDSCKRKRGKEEIEEVKGEEKLLKEDKQAYYKLVKKLKTENEVLED
jgi:hypothetical protein